LPDIRYNKIVYNFILQTIVMVSLGTMIYLVARAMPRVTETAKTEPAKDYFDELMKKLPLEKADMLATLWTEKFLRKLKIVILKLDNFLSKHLKNLKPDSTDIAEKPNLFEKKEDDRGKTD